MKNRLFVRALCVGAALLVPAGGLTILGVGTAGANTTIQFISVSKANLGTVGTATLIGGLCTVTEATTGTKQCTLILNKTTKTAQVPIKSGGNTIGKLTLTGRKALVTITPANTIKKITFKAATINNLKLIATTTANLGGCIITGMPTIAFAKTTATKFKVTTKTIGSPTVTSCAGGSTENSKVAGQLSLAKLSGTITT